MARAVIGEVGGIFSFLRPQHDDDIADRLNYFYTSSFLLASSLIISLKMFGGRPIECWLPAEYKPSWEDYSEIFCWSRNTYQVPFDEKFPESEVDREKRMISYYQWTPFFLIICALMFYSPCLIWRIFVNKSGIHLKEIVQFANERTNVQPASRQANIEGLAAHLGSVFRHRFSLGKQHPYHQNNLFRILNASFYESYVTYLYLCIKVLFISNAIFQVYLMNRFLETNDYNFYGWGVLMDLITGRPWSESGNFPRVTYCDMDVRILGNVQKHTVQCVLVINIFTEKVFIMLWVWYNLLAVVSLISLTSWISTSLPFEQRKKFVIRRLELADVEFKQAMFDHEINEFVKDYIKMDGVFVLKMLTIHSGILVCSEVVDAMWDGYLHDIGKLVESKDKILLSVDDPFHEHLSLPIPKQKIRALIPLVPQEYVEPSSTTQQNNGTSTPKPTSRKPSFRSSSAQK